MLSPGEQKLRLLHVDDAVEAILMALRGAEDQRFQQLTYGVGGDDVLTIKQLVLLLENLSGRKLHVRWGARNYRSSEIFDPVDIPRLPNWEPSISLQEGLFQLLRSKEILK